MLVWWHYVLGVIGAMIAGAFIASVFFFLHSKMQNRKQKKNIPTTKDEVSKWLQLPEIKEAMSYPGKSTPLDKKEAEEDERDRYNKYREFEKLRRVAKGESESDIKPSDERPDFKQSERGSIPDKSNSSNSDKYRTVDFD